MGVALQDLFAHRVCVCVAPVDTAWHTNHASLCMEQVTTLDPHMRPRTNAQGSLVGDDGSVDI